MGRLRLGVVGVGHLGKEHARILAGLPDVELTAVVDANPEQAHAIASRHGCRAFTDHRPLLDCVDAVVLAVPTSLHYCLAVDFLERKIPLLIEKPLAANLEQADALADLAHRNHVLLQVGHIERFNPAVEELCARRLQPKYIECERIGCFTGRSMDIGAVLDLMIHDLDLLPGLVQAPVRTVQALGVALFGRHEDVVNARLVFANGCVASLSASRISQAPSRCMRIWAPEGFVTLDFARRHVTFVQPTPALRRREFGGETWPQVKKDLVGRWLEIQERDCGGGDQLTCELQDFIRCVRTGARPRVSVEDGRAALALATRVVESLQAHPWEGHQGGATGPEHLPPPVGALLAPAKPPVAA